MNSLGGSLGWQRLAGFSPGPRFGFFSGAEECKLVAEAALLQMMVSRPLVAGTLAGVAVLTKGMHLRAAPGRSPTPA